MTNQIPVSKPLWNPNKEQRIKQTKVTFSQTYLNTIQSLIITISNSAQTVTVAPLVILRGTQKVREWKQMNQ